MKLKGKNSEKIKPAKKQKMEKTLKRMEETRKKDTDNLRARITGKIEYLVAERQKAIEAIEKYKKNIIELEGLGLKIDGALVTLKELVSNDTDV